MLVNNNAIRNVTHRIQRYRPRTCIGLIKLHVTVV